MKYKRQIYSSFLFYITFGNKNYAFGKKSILFGK